MNSPSQPRPHLIHRPAKLTITGFRDQASRLSGSSDCEEWEQWLPTILRTETLLYAQAFFAVNHINFINPSAYKPERYVLKGHAIQKIKDKLKDADAATSDGNLGAVLCMASAAHLEVSSSELGNRFLSITNTMRYRILVQQIIQCTCLVYRN